MAPDKNIKGNEFHFEDPNQLSIYNHLKRLVGPGAASFYKDACRFMASPDSFEATTHHIANCLREVKSSLIGILDVIMEGEEVTDSDFEHKKDTLLICLEQLELAQSTKEDMMKILTGKEQITERSRLTKIFRELEISENSSTALAWHETLSRRSHKMTHRNSLDKVRTMNPAFESYWNAINEGLLGVLQKFDIHFVRLIKAIDKWAAVESPTATHMSAIKNGLPNNYVTYEYLFKKIESPKWLTLLDKNGYFSSPPATLVDPDSNTVFSPKWPVLHYLGKMALCKPDEVITILHQLPTIENDSIKIQLLEIVRILPPEKWTIIIDQIKAWMLGDDDYLFPRETIELLSILTQRKDFSLALELSGVFLFAVPGLPDLPGKRKRSSNDYLYTKFLQDDFWAIAQHAPSRALEVLSNSLKKYYELSSSRKQYDDSWLTRPSIETRKGYPHNNVSDSLIDAILNIINKTLLVDETSIEKLLLPLSSKNSPVFSRICLYVLSKNPEANPVFTARFLLTKKFLKDPYCEREFSILADAALHILSKAQKQLLFEKAVHVTQEEKKKMKRFCKNEDELEARIESRKLDKLHIFAPYLSGKFKKLYSSLASIHGEPEDPKEPIVRESSSVYGPRSHVAADVLITMQPDEIIQLLSDWQPPEERHGPTPAGLGMEITNAVKKKPAEFALFAAKLKGQDPTYVRSYLQGFSAVVQTRTEFEWSGIIELSFWILEQQRDIPGRENVDIYDQDKDWGGTRQAVISLISNGLNFNSIPIDLRDDVWNIIHSLTNDPDPYPEDELTKEGDFRDDAYTITINSVRGEAISSVIEYASWLSDSGLLYVGHYLGNIRNVLDLHLNKDPSIAVRAAYAHYFSLLLYLDQQWTLAHVDEIFPLGEVNTPLYYAAWSTYLRYSRVNSKVFDILEEHYRYALTNLIPTSSEDDNDRESQSLVFHIIDLLWNGKFDLSDASSIVWLIWQHADENLRFYAIRSLGFSLEHLEDSLDPKIRERILNDMTTIWENRIAEVELAEDKTPYEKEMSAFTTWLRSGKFDALWSIKQFLKSLDICKSPYDLYFLLEYLQTLAVIYPIEVHQILAKLVVNGNFFGEDSHIRSILVSGLSNENKAIKKSALALTSMLVSHGHSSYTDLLSQD